MGIAAPPIFSHHSSNKSPVLIQTGPNYSAAVKSMSQDYQPNIFNFPGNGFERSNDQDQQQHQAQHHMAQQIRRDKLRLQGFEPMVGIEEEPANLPGYESAGMLSEMFNFPPGSGGSAGGTGELLDHSMAAAGGFRVPRTPSTPPPLPQGIGGDWYSKNQSSHHNISSMNADSAAAMQLFLMNPQTRSPSPPHQPQVPASSTLHMLLPNPSPSSSLQGFSVPSIAAGAFTGVGSMIAPPPPPQQFAFGGGGSDTEVGRFVEGQGLSLSLSSSLQHLEAAKAEGLRNMGSDGLLFYSHEASNSPASASSQYPSKLNFSQGQNYPANIGYGSSLGIVNVLRNSKFLKAAQELLEEFCSVGRGHFKKTKLGRSANPTLSNPGSSGNNNNNGGGASSSSTSKENHPLSAGDRMEHQRRKVKLISMLDEACKLSLSLPPPPPLLPINQSFWVNLF